MPMQYKIPKNVGIEDKLFFFLTLRQLIICGVGGTICYVLYVMFNQLGVITWLIPSVFISLLTCLIAFFQFNNMTFTRIVLRLIEFNTLPIKRVFYVYNDGITHLNTLEAMLSVTASDNSKKPKITIKNVENVETDLGTLTELLDVSERTHSSSEPHSHE